MMHTLAIVVAFPVPEEGNDFTDIRSTGNVFQGLVVDRDRGGAFERFTFVIGDADS